MAVIYLLTNNITNKQYVGFTTDYNRRMNFHKSHYADTHISHSIGKYGWSNFSNEIIYENEDSEYTLNIKESEFIAKYDTFNNGYNLTTGGEGCIGFKHSKQEIENMRNRVIGENNPNHKSKGRLNPMMGKTHTQKSIDKMRENRKGLTMGENNPMYGKGYLISGSKNSNAKKVTMNGVKYGCMLECSEKTGLSLYKIRKYINSIN